MNFRVETFGKWILVGEHAVLRGSPALVFPVHQKPLVLQYEENSQPLQLLTGGANGSDLNLLFWGVLEKGLSLVGKNRSDIKGTLEIVNSVPIGSGMGASAALCVALGKWFEWKKWIASEKLFDFSKELENLFHGESSGVDIAVILHNSPIHFERNGTIYPLKNKWQPQWYLSHCGERGITADCVQTVNVFCQKHPREGSQLDQQMIQAAADAEKALTQLDQQEGLPLLVDSINKAYDCFSSWGLITPGLSSHIDLLFSLGAVAAKPTGSGKGGFVLSLWDKPPQGTLSVELIPV